MDESFRTALHVVRTLKAAGFAAYFVGGAVRDWLSGCREINDIDIATSASAHEIVSLFEKTVIVNNNHDTVIIRMRHVAFEVTSFRKSKRQLPFIAPSIFTDLLARDFTINAIAMDEKFTIIDPFHHQLDLKNKLIRAVVEPRARFLEDPLRMLRAIRFVSQLGFNIEQKTKNAISDCGPLLKTIPVERLTREIERLLMGNYINKAIVYLLDSGLVNDVFFLKKEKDTLKALAKYPLEQLITIEERWALFLYLQNKETKDRFFHGFHYSRKKINEVLFLVRATEELLNTGWTPFFLYKAGLAKAIKIRRLIELTTKASWNKTVQEITEMYTNLPIRERSEMDINGAALIDFFQKSPGEWIEKYLQLAERAIIENKVVNKKDKILSWLKKEVANVEGKTT